ncbi:type IV pili methyl-accepting chemotaxis transducer N-terminal domain-containing protein [Vogesella indigofera]|uniref:type IV pili methyl-accepting chemotaxis transducer N-terminal domain-containing protein n=1 Tax=Vogesella indigofera TaxID=45465 RepID=UPI00234FA319|nr:type IV pili methyl-accepting chemotaxis transducer N-terminal domain-containing protein [Vogesella indigofera]MDC7709929.1 type IV pili methyl-accepting chemotaxis transducer N-terminal domain-containing protein [Vogesella indigofera]
MPLPTPPSVRSLSSKLLILTIVWLVLAMTSIGYTLVLSWKLEGGAAAINDAGSLRMRSYRVALLVSEGADAAQVQQEAAQFNDTMARLRKGDPARPLFLPDNAEVRSQAAEIARYWQHEMLPKMAQVQLDPQRNTTRVDLGAFVNRIDKLVRLVEEDNARNTTLLRFFQMMLMAMAIIGAITMMYLMFLLIIRPLNELGEAIVQVRDGELATRVPVVGNDEFAILSAGFNQMAGRLQELYATLEDKVRDKTRSLDEKNRQLTTLYGVTTYLHESHDLNTMCKGFIERLIQLTNADAASVRIVDSKRGKLEPVAQIGLPDGMIHTHDCAHIDSCYCGAAVDQPSSVIRLFRELPQKEQKHCERAGFRSVSIFHIRVNQQNVGIFTLYFRDDTRLSAQEQFLIETLGSHLGVAIENLRLAARDRQFAVSEERNLMAQGLHDSIAQSLSFLNLQVQMLESALGDTQDEQARENLAFIKTGVQECYEDVRELLLNFRTRISKEDFPDAVNTLLKRFEQQARVLTQYQLRGNGLPLNPEQQLQVIFILQEALSNVRKHAQAHRVDIDIDNHDDFVMRISDDGCGFDAAVLAARQARHVGMSIMQERASRINARIQIENRDGGGTTVTLTLPHTERQAA